MTLAFDERQIASRVGDLGQVDDSAVFYGHGYFQFCAGAGAGLFTAAPALASRRAKAGSSFT